MPRFIVPRRRIRRRRRRRRRPPNDQLIRETYKRPGHPTAFSSPATVARHHNITVDRARRILQHEDAYNLHREYKRPRSFNPYYIRQRRKLVQADLIDIRNIEQHNDNTKFLLLLIDVFSRMVWLYPLRNKSAKTMKTTMENWINRLFRLPETIMTDKGTEFWNHQVRTLLRNNGITLQLATGTCKAAYAERANKTLQVLIYKYLTEHETLRYIDKLDDLVRSYNRRGHRSLEFMSPIEADRPRNRARVCEIAERRWSKVKRREPTLGLGQMVRVKTEAKAISSSRRAYAEQFKGEFFTIHRINRTLPIPMYYLRSLDTDELIDGAFYANELTRIRGDVFKIDHVIRWRGRGRNRQALVRWKYFGPRHDSWVAEADILRVY